MPDLAVWDTMFRLGFLVDHPGRSGLEDGVPRICAVVHVHGEFGQGWLGNEHLIGVEASSFSSIPAIRALTPNDNICLMWPDGVGIGQTSLYARCNMRWNPTTEDFEDIPGLRHGDPLPQDNPRFRVFKNAFYQTVYAEMDVPLPMGTQVVISYDPRGCFFTVDSYDDVYYTPYYCWAVDWGWWWSRYGEQ